MSIKLSKIQKERLFANHARAVEVGPDAMRTMKPVFAVFAPSPVSHLLAAIEAGQHLRPDDMLVAYLANRIRPNEAMCLLQQADRTCFFGFWNLDVFCARSHELGKSIEVLDLADDSIDFDTSCSLLNPYMADGSLLGGTRNEDDRKFELILTLSRGVEKTVARPSLQLHEMKEDRLLELRCLAA